MKVCISEEVNLNKPVTFTIREIFESLDCDEWCEFCDEFGYDETIYCEHPELMIGLFPKDIRKYNIKRRIENG